MASTADIRNGLCIKFNHDIYKIIEFLSEPVKEKSSLTEPVINSYVKIGKTNKPKLEAKKFRLELNLT